MGFFPQLAGAFQELVDRLEGARACVIGHARPDGDCVGAQIAMTRLLQNRGIEARALNIDPVPKAMRFLKDYSLIDSLDETSLDGGALVFVDCADEFRVGMGARHLVENRSIEGNIDHHISNTRFSECDIVDEGAAATCEMIAGMAFDLDWAIDADTAQALLTGIMTDTGRFGYLATSSRVFQICGKLVESGAQPHVTAQALYENEPVSRLKLLQRFLDSLRVLHGGSLGVGVLKQRDFLDTNAIYEETEGFVDYARGIEGVKIGVYLEERKTMVKASLRSESFAYRVDGIAKSFGGGGHACAAAFSSNRPLEEVKSKLLSEIEARLTEIENRSANAS